MKIATSVLSCSRSFDSGIVGAAHTTLDGPCVYLNVRNVLARRKLQYSAALRVEFDIRLSLQLHPFDVTSNGTESTTGHGLGLYRVK